jgi:Zn-dependent peptidase ImmA (M78 family)
MPEMQGQDGPAGDLERLITATDEFSPHRLTLAREMAGLEIKELAERIDASSSAVSQFEKGKTRPRTETLIRLALAVGVPPEFFAAQPLRTIPPEFCHFRSLRSASMKERRRVLAYGTVLNSLASYLQDYVNFPAEQISAVRERFYDGIDAESAADLMRDVWNLGHGPISNTVALMESKGVILVEVPGHSARLDAFSVWVDGRPIVFLSTEKNSGSRRRFDVVHEIAHLLLHTDGEPGSSTVEREADAFASAFLLPRIPFFAECPRRLDWKRMREMKKRWGVSLAAIIRRAFDLGIFSEATYRRAYVFLNQTGWRTSEPDEPSMEHPSLLQRAVALLGDAGYSLARIASELRVGEGLLQRLLTPPRAEQGLLL